MALSNVRVGVTRSGLSRIASANSEIAASKSCFLVAIAPRLNAILAASGSAAACAVRRQGLLRRKL